MAKRNDPLPMHACMTPRSDLRRVHDPHDERVAGKRSHRMRGVLAKFVVRVRP